MFYPLLFWCRRGEQQHSQHSQQTRQSRQTQSPRQVQQQRASLCLPLLLALLLTACSAPPKTKPAPLAPLTHSQTGPASTARAPSPGSGMGIDMGIGTGIDMGAASAPAAPREMRAAWVSTVSNIDWPSRKNLSSAQQQAEIIALLDTAARLKLNTIILQVRPSADTIYPSTLEPWSEFLTGTQGKAPEPFYDPLQMWIELAHARGLELHAWFNPYRAKTAATKPALAATHISKTAPAVVKRYGDLLWMDPGEPAAMQHTLAVIGDVLRRYDVDGIQLDDYFYPYPLADAHGGELAFPDEASWAKYRHQGGQLTRADWRRQNVNHLVEAAYHAVHTEKSWVKFGISPFGIGRPDRLPKGIKGFSQYDKLYADVELWLEQGWLDYLAPQLYWPLAQQAQSFTVLRDYWQAQNTRQRHIWPGLYTNKLDTQAGKKSAKPEQPWPAEEILQQIGAARANHAGSSGHLHFSISALMKNRQNIQQRLLAEKYQHAALVPASPWLLTSSMVAMTAPPLAPIGGQQLRVTLTAGAPLRWLAVWKRYQAGKNEPQWIFSLQTADNPVISLADDLPHAPLRQVVVSALDRSGQESPRSSYTLP